MTDEKTPAPEKAAKDPKVKPDYSRLAALKVALAAINKEHGGSTIGIGAALRPARLPRLSSGSLAMDFGLGGGYAVGRLTIFYGDESGGKTEKALRAIAEAQELCAHCLRPIADFAVGQTLFEEVDKKTGEVKQAAEWEATGTCTCLADGLFRPRRLPIQLGNGQTRLETDTEFAARIEGLRGNSFSPMRIAMLDAEGTFDPAWFARLGGDARLLIYVAPATAEEGIDIYEALLRTGAIDIAVIDSLIALTPAIEVEESSEKEQRAALAKLLGKLVRIENSATTDVYRDYGKLITRFWINQMRIDMKITWGDNEIMPGGNAPRFAASTIVKCWPSKWEAEECLDGVKDADQVKLGTKVRMNFLVKKNKTAASRASGGYLLTLAGPDAGHIDEVGFIQAMAMRHDYLGKEEGRKGGEYYLRLPGAERTYYAKQKDQLAAFVAPRVLRALRAALLEHMLDAVARGEAV